MATYNGTAANDTYTGTSSADTINGLGGDDTLNGADGNDTIDGGAGNDTLNGGTGDDTLDGGSGNDQLNGSTGFDWVDYRDAASGVTVRLSTSGSQNTFGAGSDTLQAIEAIFGSAFNDHLYGAADDNTLRGEGGNDYLAGGAGNDTLEGGDGSDILNGGDGYDLLDGGLGFDWADYREASQGIVLWLDGGFQANDASLISIEGVYGSNFEDSIRGLAAEDDVLRGEGGDDELFGTGGSDKLYGGDGNDRLTIEGIGGSNLLDGGAGNDAIWLQGAPVGVNTLLGGEGNDSIDLYGIATPDTPGQILNGGAGYDTLGAYLSNDGEVDLTASTVVNFESIQTNSNSLKLTAAQTNGLIDILGSYLTITTAGVIDLTNATRLPAYIELVVGGATLNLAGAVFSDKWGQVGTLTIYGSTGVDAITGGASKDVVHGGAGRDTIDGDGGNDQIFGEAGADVLSGAAGDDHVDGGDNADTVTGGAGADQLYGGAGADILQGGDDDDVLWVNTGDYSTGEQYSGGAGWDILRVGAHVNFSTAIFSHDIEKLEADYANITIRAEDLAGFQEISTLSLSISTAGSVDFSDTAVTGQINLLVEGITLDNSGNSNVVYGSSGVDHIIGGATANGGGGNDELQGDDLVNSFGGDAGDDLINGAGGADGLRGGLGNDVIDGGAGNDTIQGNDDNDLLAGGSGADVIEGGSGNDVINGGVGNDSLYGDAGIDTLSYAEAAGSVSVQLVNDGASGGTSSGADGFDTFYNFENLTGSAFNDLLVGSAGANVIDGGEGDDILKGGLGADTLNGGAGLDKIDYGDKSAAVVVNLATQTATVGGIAEDTLLSMEGAIGGSGNDTLIGDGGANTLEGGGGDDLLRGGDGSDTLNGGAGLDCADYGDRTAALVVNLATQSVTVGGVAEDSLSSIERVLAGSGDDTLTGDAGANQLFGGGGADLLKGGLGADLLDGGSGIDTADYSDRTIGVAVSLAAGVSSVDGVLEDTLTGIEKVIGGSAADTLIGDGAANELSGGGGDDLLRGGAGADVLEGGDGLDTADYSDKTTSIVAVLNSGASATVRVGGVSEDTLLGVENITGGSANDTLTGDAVANVLRGGGGADVLDGATGADAMHGGAGNDRYEVDNAGDTVVEAVGEGADNVFASVSFTLSDNVENLFLAGSAEINGTGNDLVNRLYGNAAKNILMGGGGNDRLDGGAGGDSLRGGTGDDVYIVDDAGDRAVEAAGEGYDLVYSSTTFTLGADVEDLILTGDAAVTGAGNALANRITGNAADNLLVGGDGADRLNGAGGADTMRGGLGDDLYYVDQLGDVIVEYSGQGVDTVIATITYGITSGYENITLAGSAAIDATGNNLANVLTGNDADNAITGLRGADRMWGKGGADSFVFNALADSLAGQEDRIVDFDPLVDVIDLSLIDANTALSGNQAFTWAGAFSGQAGEAVLSYNAAANQTVLTLDANGDGVADFRLLIDGNITGDSGFIL